MTLIPVHVPLRPNPKPHCYICGCSCIDAGDQGRIVPHAVPTKVRGYLRCVIRRVRACANCREDD